jgi:hypothetical protein
MTARDRVAGTFQRQNTPPGRCVIHGYPLGSLRNDASGKRERPATEVNPR